MTTPFFTVTSDGLTATVDALTPIVQGVSDYFTNSARAIAIPVPVYAGAWEDWRHTSDGPPGRIIIAQTDFQILDVGAWPGPSGMRYAPGDRVDLSSTQWAPVVGVRAQMFRVVVKGLANKGQTFAADAPGSAAALANVVAAYALADLTFAALRDLHGHNLGAIKWTPMGAERGECAYGSVLVGGFGPIPIPVLGDVGSFVTVTKVQGNVSMPPATPGDTVYVP